MMTDLVHVGEFPIGRYALVNRPLTSYGVDVLTGQESWVPNEVLTAGRENLDPAHVARYDRKEHASANAESELMRSRHPSAATVIDIGAGTGQFAIAASDWANQVVAVDVSPVMLGGLRMKLAAAAIRNVECVEAGFLTYCHQGDGADVVYSRLALHHLPDFWKAVALTRVAAMLKPGGLFRLWDVVYSFGPDEAPATLERWFGTTAGAAVDDDWVRDELEEHVRDEHSTFTWLLEPMIERAGLRILERSYSADQIVAEYICDRAR
jgi:ubiquinone/menaquinone biosynthesis C-methylase UbiE